MIVFTRKRDQILTIGKSIVIRIVEIGFGRVKLDIRAPENFPVIRPEIVDAIIGIDKKQ